MNKRPRLLRISLKTLFPQSVGFQQLMSCHRCGKPLGNPCAVCRTISRIQFAWERLTLPGDEVRVLNLVRDCAGGVLDLLESQGNRAAAAEEKPSGERKAPEDKAEDREDKKEKTRKRSREDRSRDRGDRRRRRREERPEDKREELPEEPLEGKEKKSRPESVKEEQTEEEYSSGGSRRSVTPIAGEEPGSARDRVREGDGREDRGVSEADREVLANPERHGLGFLPRGSVGNHFDRSKPDEGEQRGKGSDRPHVSTRDRAPRRDHRGDTGERKRSRQPKSKGKNKRERGQAWRRAREQERWHPKGRW